QQFFGIANLYGMLSLETVTDMLIDLMIEPMDPISVCSILLNSLSIRRALFEMESKTEVTFFVLSPYVTDPQYLELLLQQRCDITRYKPYDKEIVLAAGERPLPLMPNEKQKELIHFFRKSDFSEQHIRYSLCYLWLNLQLNTNPMSAITEVIGGGLDSMAQLQEAVEFSSEYCNHVPRWFLKGFSPTESKSVSGSKEKSPANVREGENLCSCGSGKKYQKCCGAN
ncbi:MAG: YecA family protein, partial [Bacteroidales bacterium]